MTCFQVTYMWLVPPDWQKCWHAAITPLDFKNQNFSSSTTLDRQVRWLCSCGKSWYRLQCTDSKYWYQFRSQRSCPPTFAFTTSAIDTQPDLLALSTRALHLPRCARARNSFSGEMHCELCFLPFSSKHAQPYPVPLQPH